VPEIPRETRGPKASQRPDDPDLTALVDLQRFLADELSGTTDLRGLSRSFLPLTDGLGLGSPSKAAETRAPQPAPARPPAHVPTPDAIFETDPLPAPAKPPPIQARAKAPAPKPDAPKPPPKSAPKPSALAKALGREIEPAMKPSHAPVTRGLDFEPYVPPPQPTPSFFTRLMAGLLDEFFVATLWCLSLAITFTLLSGKTLGATEGFFKDLANPVFVRFVILEFATIWLAYFAVCIGLLDMTLGMWAWGMRISYTVGSSDGRFLKKVLRIFFSFAFYAPVFTAVLLGISWRGRNLLDRLSGTGLYRV